MIMLVRDEDTLVIHLSARLQIRHIQGGSAAEAGLRPGDLITEVNRTTIRNLNDYQEALQKIKKGENLLLLVKRDSGSFYVVLTPSANGQ